jgi:hypothetical protein
MMQTCTQGVAMGRGGAVMVRFLHRVGAHGNPPLEQPDCGDRESKTLLGINH